MYDELIKRLRYLAKVYSICDNENTNEYRLAIEAADAIEELQAKVDENKKCYQMMAEAYEHEVTKAKWVSVKERLPEVGKKVLVFAYGNDTLTARMQKRTENGYPVFECNGIFLEMAKLGRITHWMPLPEPPESEGE